MVLFLDEAKKIAIKYIGPIGLSVAIGVIELIPGQIIVNSVPAHDNMAIVNNDVSLEVSVRIKSSSNKTSFNQVTVGHPEIEHVEVSGMTVFFRSGPLVSFDAGSYGKIINT